MLLCYVFCIFYMMNKDIGPLFGPYYYQSHLITSKLCSNFNQHPITSNNAHVANRRL